MYGAAARVLGSRFRPPAKRRARLGAAWSPGVSLNDATRASIGTEALGPEASRASRNDRWSQGRAPSRRAEASGRRRD